MDKHTIGSILIVIYVFIGFYKGYDKEVFLLLGISICVFFSLYVLSEALFDVVKKLDEILKELKDK
jgi:hypothetical protein